MLYNKATLLTLCHEYAATPSVIGFERIFLQMLAKRFRTMGLHVIEPDAQRCLVIQGSKPHQSIITTHADRHGLVSVGPHTALYAAAHRRMHLGLPLSYHSDDRALICRRFIGTPVYSYDPSTGKRLGSYTIKKGSGCDDGSVDDIFFTLQNDTSHTSSHICLPRGTPLSYINKVIANTTHFTCQLDNFLSIVIMTMLYEEGYQGTLIITTDEEIGYSAPTLSNTLQKLAYNPHITPLYTLDTTPFTIRNDIAHHPVVLRFRDAYASYNADLTRDLIQLASLVNVPVLIKDAYIDANNTVIGKKTQQHMYGKTELGALLALPNNTGKQFRGTTIQIPTLNYHTDCEKVSFAAVRNVLTLLGALVLPHTT